MNNYERRLTNAYNTFAKGRGYVFPLILVGSGIWNYYLQLASKPNPKTVTMISAKVKLDTSLGPNDFVITHG